MQGEPVFESSSLYWGQTKKLKYFQCQCDVSGGAMRGNETSQKSFNDAVIDDFMGNGDTSTALIYK